VNLFKSLKELLASPPPEPFEGRLHPASLQFRDLRPYVGGDPIPPEFLTVEGLDKALMMQPTRTKRIKGQHELRHTLAHMHLALEHVAKLVDCEDALQDLAECEAAIFDYEEKPSWRSLYGGQKVGSEGEDEDEDQDDEEEEEEESLQGEVEVCSSIHPVRGVRCLRLANADGHSGGCLANDNGVLVRWNGARDA
jgi:hypothetical protein